MKSFKFILSFIFVVIVFLNISFSQTSKTPANNSTEINPIKVGEKIPDVIVKNINGDDVSLTKLSGEKQTIIVFYRGGWCPFCNKQLLGLAKIQQDLNNLGYQILAISSDKPERANETMTTDSLGYTLLSDYNSEASTAFGVAFIVDDKTVELYKSYKIDLEERMGNKNHILPVPSVFILDKSGTIKYEYVNADYKIRLDSDEMLSQAKIHKQ